jgi:hypothetical protein
MNSTGHQFPPLPPRPAPFARFARGVPWGVVVCAVLAQGALTAVFCSVAFVVPANPAPPVLHIENPEAPASLLERIDLMDSEPLYLPTPRNYGYENNAVVPADFDAGMGGPPLPPFEPEPRVRTGEPLFPPPAATPPALKTLLPLAHWRVAATLGLQAQPGPAAPPPRQAVMRVEDAATGEVVRTGGAPLEMPVNLNLAPAVVGAPWRPAAFSHWVDRQGAVGAPVPMPWTDGAAGSGNPQVDAALRAFLATPAAIPPLPPGYYRIIIGP